MSYQRAMIPKLLSSGVVLPPSAVPHFLLVWATRTSPYLSESSTLEDSAHLRFHSIDCPTMYIVVSFEVELMKDLGVKIELGRGLGKDGLQIKQLLQDGYECVFIGIGLPEPKVFPCLKDSLLIMVSIHPKTFCL